MMTTVMTTVALTNSMMTVMTKATMTTIPDLMFLETSALTSENVEETFLKCARNILAKIESGRCRIPGLDVHKRC